MDVLLTFVDIRKDHIEELVFNEKYFLEKNAVIHFDI